MSDEIVHKIASKDMVVVSEDATMRQAVELMRTKGIRHLPVTNSFGRIVGILSDRDVRHVRNTMKVNDFEHVKLTTCSDSIHLNVKAVLVEVTALHRKIFLLNIE